MIPARPSGWPVLDLFATIGPMKTRGDVFRFSIAFALSKACKVVRGLRYGLTEAERYEVADSAVYHLKKHGDPWRLDEDQPPPEGPIGHGMPEGWCKPKP
jgi:hypothetical protein